TFRFDCSAFIASLRVPRRPQRPVEPIARALASRRRWARWLWRGDARAYNHADERQDSSEFSPVPRRLAGPIPFTALVLCDEPPRRLSGPARRGRSTRLQTWTGRSHLDTADDRYPATHDQARRRAAGHQGD